ncbi:transglycosylase domain-containing protein [Anaerosporobacter faecicola]|uniref:transglycosylase domain-containing protein n=1 Tax=Anaerosporobacter faecicola TaxID=2718714 RepID=UPI001439B3EB|nr:PBP1A family penicillin-binding protein [Anaerosporobacter faecicola]
MDFSKRGTANKQRDTHSASQKLTRKALISCLRTCIVCIVAISIIGTFTGLGALKGMLDSAPSIDSIDVAPTGFSTIIYDSEGNEIQKLVGSQANRIYVTLEKIPDNVKNAFIAIEDERFYSHNGIDVKGIFRAFFVGVKSGRFSEGASTLTQQLLKNQVFEGGNEEKFFDKVQRKVQEQYLAIKLEDKLSKDQILEYYLNTINLGQGTLGVQAASLRYFNKDVSDLTLSEATVIAGITQSPVYLNPITHPEDNKDKREIILSKMLEQELITQKAYDKALKDDVYERIQMVNEEQINTSTSTNSYFVDELILQVQEDLQNKLGYTETQAINAIYRGGLRIYSTQDTSLQNICDTVINDESNYPEAYHIYELTYALSIQKADGSTINYSEGHLKNYFSTKKKNFDLFFKDKKDADAYTEEFKSSVTEEGDEVLGEKKTFTLQPQVSFVLMDQHNGKVLALVGGRGDKEGSLTLNRATRTLRQPGSTFKVLSTYLPALDNAGMTLATVQDDAPYKYPGTNTTVNNWRRGVYNGLTTLRQGIWDSNNIVTVKTLEQITPQLGYSYLMKLGFTTIVDSVTTDDGKVHSDINLPMALGGLTYGIKNLEITAAFASIANEGIYTEPVLYTKIMDHEGNLLVDNHPSTCQVMKESTAFLLTSAMQDVVKIGTAASYVNLGSMPVAGKTGTTTDSKDLWFIGYTPYYTGGIWGGYDNNNRDQNAVNTSYHKRLWNIIMNQIHEGYKKKNFTKPDSIVTALICTKSGKLAKDGVCEFAPGGSTVKKEYFAKGTVPTEVCDCHVKLRICKSSGLQASEFCPESDVEEKVFLIKEETGKTKDTPNLLPKSLEDSTCNVHSSSSFNEIIPTPGEQEGELPEDEEEEDVIPPIPDVEEPPIPNDNTNTTPSEGTEDQPPSEGQ